MCEGFTQVGYRPLLLGRRATNGQERGATNALFEYYGIQNCFDVQLMRIPHLRRFGVALGVSSSIVFACIAVMNAKKIKPCIVYTRDIYTAWLATGCGLPVVFEEHERPRRKLHEWMRRQLFRSRHTLGIVFISNALSMYYKDTGLITGERVRTIVAPDAAALSQVRPMRDLTKRKTVAHVVGYVGSVLPGRGIELILSIASRLPEAQFKIIGGTAQQVRGLSSQTVPSNVECLGVVPPGKLTSLFDDIDILLMPYQNHTTTRGGTVSAQWMSPLKMFEYMASGVPLIASDLPVLREVLQPERNCLMVAPDDVEAWAQAIQRLAGAPELRQHLVASAIREIRSRYNWPARAKRILERFAL